MASLAAEEEAAQRAATEEAISQLGEVLEMAKEHGPKQPQLREMASEFFLGLTDTEQGRRALHTQGATKVLLSWCGDSVDAVAASSYEALVNLSSDVLEARLEFMLGLKAVDRVFETLKDNAVSARLTNAALMFLSNLTTAKDACMDALQSSLGDPLLIGVRMRRLVEKFLDPALQPKAEGELDAWEHVASVLCNVSQLQDGRDLLRRRSTNVLPRLILELESPSAVRRRGTAAALRNCCYETLDHDWLLHEVGLLGRLLLSLAGPEPMTAGETNGMEELVLTKLEAQGANKQREPDFETRKAILNALHLLCSTKTSRQYMRRKRAYPIIRNADMAEEEGSELKEMFYSVVSFLIKDEEEGDNEDVIGAGDPEYNPDDDLVHGSPDLPQNRSRADIERSEKTGLLMEPEDLEDDDGAMNTVD